MVVMLVMVMATVEVVSLLGEGPAVHRWSKLGGGPHKHCLGWENVPAHMVWCGLGWEEDPTYKVKVGKTNIHGPSWEEVQTYMV